MDAGNINEMSVYEYTVQYSYVATDIQYTALYMLQYNVATLVHSSVHIMVQCYYTRTQCCLNTSNLKGLPKTKLLNVLQFT